MAVCVDFPVCCCGKEAVLAGIPVLLLLCETSCDSYQVHSSGALDHEYSVSLTTLHSLNKTLSYDLVLELFCK